MVKVTEILVALSISNLQIVKGYKHTFAKLNQMVI